MFAPARHLQTLPLQKALAAAPARPVSFQEILVLCAFLIAGLIWQAVGGAVMSNGRD